MLEAAVDLVRAELGDCAVFAALPEGSGFRVAISAGTTDPRFNEILVRHGTGLGGYVLDRGAAALVEDYPNDPRISRDFVHIVSRGEGLHGIVCVPVVVQGRPEGLLYAGRRGVGSIGDRAAEQLEDAARYAAVGIQQAQERRNALELERLRDRERLAGMLHDSVAQMLFGIGVAAQRSLRAGDADTLEEAMREIETTAADARRELRATLQRLADSHAEMQLVARLQAQVEVFSTQSDCKTRIIRSGTARRLPDLVEELIVDVVVEGLRNAVKHAGARFALVYFDYEADSVLLAVQCEVAENHVAPVNGTGLGLRMLSQRARNAGGRLALVPGDDGLKVLRLEVPA